MSNGCLTKMIILSGLLALALGSSVLGQQTKNLYENNLEKLALGPLPEEEFLVLEGGFAVKEEAGNRFIELPGAPLETFGVLFGPVQKEDVLASVRAFGTGKGRRYPSFGLGVGGQGGYRLQVAPAKKTIELHRGDTVKASVPFEWQSGQWTQLKLQVKKLKDGEWKIQGKVWQDGTAEPSGWTITAEEKQDLPNGRASIWGSPYSGTPIRFDDLIVAR